MALISLTLPPLFRSLASVLVLFAAALFAWAPPAHARVTKIIIGQTTSISGQPLYEQLTGRAFGQLDPNDPHNALITDLALPPQNQSGKVEYIASFVIRKPIQMSSASGLIWHDVPNRGGNVAFTADLFAAMDTQLLSGWQGDNAGVTALPANATSPSPTGSPLANHWVMTPKLAGVTGRIIGRIINRTGTNQPLNVMGNPIPYFPANSADNSDAVLKTHVSETINGVVTEGATLPNSDWKFCYGAGAPHMAAAIVTAAIAASTKRSPPPARPAQETIGEPPRSERTQYLRMRSLTACGSLCASG